MISEKELYKTQAEWALTHTRYPDVIWAEDLFDITVVPYQGSIRKLPHYADMKDRLELYGLIVVMHTIQEVRILECRADVEKKSVIHRGRNLPEILERNKKEYCKRHGRTWSSG